MATETVVELPAAEFRHAGAISVVTVGDEQERTGFVATSVSSFSAEPPRLILCIDRSSSPGLHFNASGRSA